MLFYALSCALVLLLFSWFFLTGTSGYHDGPMPIPLLGNLATVRQLRKDPETTLLMLRERWGDLCMLWFGSQPVLIVNSARAAKEMLDEVRSRATQEHPQRADNLQCSAAPCIRRGRP